MGMAADDIVSLIKTALPDAVIDMTDLAGDNDHWKAVVTSAAFIGKGLKCPHSSPLRHRTRGSFTHVCT